MASNEPTNLQAAILSIIDSLTLIEGHDAENEKLSEKLTDALAHIIQLEKALGETAKENVRLQGQLGDMTLQ